MSEESVPKETKLWRFSAGLEGNPQKEKPNKVNMFGLEKKLLQKDMLSAFRY